MNSILTTHLEEEHCGTCYTFEDMRGLSAEVLSEGQRQSWREYITQACDHCAVYMGESSCGSMTWVSEFVSQRSLTQPAEHTRANPHELPQRANINLRQG